MGVFWGPWSKITPSPVPDWALPLQVIPLIRTIHKYTVNVLQCSNTWHAYNNYCLKMTEDILFASIWCLCFCVGSVIFANSSSAGWELNCLFCGFVAFCGCMLHFLLRHHTCLFSVCFWNFLCINWAFLLLAWLVICFLHQNEVN